MCIKLVLIMIYKYFFIDTNLLLWSIKRDMDGSYTVSTDTKQPLYTYTVLYVGKERDA